MSALHGEQTLADGIHGIVALEFADATDRGNFANETNGRVNGPEQVGKVARQTDNSTHWLLINNAPITWAQIDAGGATLPVALEASATTDTSEPDTGGAEVVVTGMTLSPPAGTYVATFTGAVGWSTSSDSAVLSIYVNGVKQDKSERDISRGGSQGNVDIGFCCQAKIVVGAGQDVEGRWEVDGGGTATMGARTLILQEVAP